jgi:hypothetical protein
VPDGSPSRSRKLPARSRQVSKGRRTHTPLRRVNRPRRRCAIVLASGVEEPTAGGIFDDFRGRRRAERRGGCSASRPRYRGWGRADPNAMALTPEPAPSPSYETPRQPARVRSRTFALVQDLTQVASVAQWTPAVPLVRWGVTGCGTSRGGAWAPATGHRPRPDGPVIAGRIGLRIEPRSVLHGLPSPGVDPPVAGVVGPAHTRRESPALPVGLQPCPGSPREAPFHQMKCWLASGIGLARG